MQVAELQALAQRFRDEIAKAVTGQTRTVDLMLTALFSGGHVLLEGPPGVAKTLIAQSFARTLGLEFGRIQFTPDLMPGDILGSNLFNFQTSAFSLTRGPIFCDLLLADEINRTPPKTQAAMLEAMQERMITAGGRDYELPKPFFVLATQNPLEQEGTYPLPEAQLDRFLLYIKVGYPSPREEWEIARRVTSGQGKLSDIQPVLDAEQILAAQSLVQRVPVADQVVGYAWALVRASRPGQPGAPDFVNKWVNWGAGPRGVLAIISCAKAHALLSGRYHATVADVQAVVRPALRHRIAPNYAGLAAGVTSEKLIEMLLEANPADKPYEMPKA
jgi:MoxR-like ATPase